MMTHPHLSIHVKSVIRDGDVAIYSQLSLRDTKIGHAIHFSFKMDRIIFTNQNTHNIFYYKTLGNVTFEICNLNGHICIYYQHKTPEELH